MGIIVLSKRMRFVKTPTFLAVLRKVPVEAWQIEMREGFRNAESLLKFLEIPFDSSKIEGASPFPLRVPVTFANRMTKGNINDPLLLQVLPLLKENNITPDFQQDAVGDLKALKQKGLIQKYHGRVLLIMTGACAIHCRYCFRRHFPYGDQLMNSESKREVLGLLDADSSIEEVIFSGGDPLLLTNHQLEEWAKDLKQISHIKRWRIHSRLPSVLPSRIDSGLVKVLSQFQDNHRQTILVTHINHPNEINTEVTQALTSLRLNKIYLLNQSVLLQKINDAVPTLKTLSEKLFEGGVLPYYLHLLDRTQGTQHFEVESQRSMKIYQELSSVLPGYLVPKLVREIEGQPHKVIIGHS